MNINFEEGLNFGEELNKMMGNEENMKIEKCLISGTELKEDFIKLNCGHKFNYEYLLNEIKIQRKKNRLEVQNLRKTQIKCPYCRNVQNKLLPRNDNYEEILNVNCKIKGVKFCEAILLSGKRKGKKCGCKAKQDNYCGRHKKK